MASVPAEPLLEDEELEELLDEEELAGGMVLGSEPLQPADKLKRPIIHIEKQIFLFIHTIL